MMKIFVYARDEGEVRKAEQIAAQTVEPRNGQVWSLEVAEGVHTLTGKAAFAALPETKAIFAAGPVSDEEAADFLSAAEEAGLRARAL